MKLELEVKQVLTAEQQKLVNTLYEYIERITEVFLSSRENMDNDAYLKLVTPHFVHIANIQKDSKTEVIIVSEN